MNDEIKEILDKLEIVARKHTIEVCDDGSKIETMPASIVDELRLNNFSGKLLLDYITNLQEENEKLKMRNDMLRKDIDSFINDNKVDYKSRIEKAVEFIKEDMYSEPNELYGLIDGEHLLNILNGRSDE